MTPRWGNGGSQGGSLLDDPAAAMRLALEHDTLTPQTPLEAVKARVLRPGFIIALCVTIGVAATSLLMGIPADHGGVTALTRTSGGGAPAQASVGVVPSWAAPAELLSSREPQFLDSDEAGRLAYRSGKYEEALARFKTAIERNPVDAESMSNAAQILVRLGRVDEAMPLLQRAIEINPARWTYRFNLARALDQAGQVDQAIQQYEVAASLFPDDYVTLFNLGQTYHKQGNETEAVERYQRAIALNPGEPTFHFALAISLEKQGKNAEAGAAYARFLELVPDSTDAARVRERIARLQSAEAQQPTDASSPGAERPPIK